MTSDLTFRDRIHSDQGSGDQGDLFEFAAQPDGGVTTEQDLRDLADLIRGKNIAVLSDEPYCHMVWKGRHRSLLEFPGMMDQCVAAYTFSKSYSMSGWRLGFAFRRRRSLTPSAR